jgi:hypothetical protein
MKNLKLAGVQELSTVEMEKLEGGCFWCDVGRVANNVVRPVIGGTLAIGGVVTGNPILIVTGVGLAVTK